MPAWIKQPLKTTCAFSLVLLSVALCCPFAGAAEYIGFASMKVPVVKDPLTAVRLQEFTKTLYGLKYSSFQRVADSQNLTGLRPKTLEIANDTGRMVKLNPSRSNFDAIALFHEEFEGGYEGFLNEIGAYNEARAIVFDKSEDEAIIAAKKFGKDPNATLVITLFAFYRDSNTLAMDFIDIDKDLMGNFPRLKTVIQDKVVEVAEQVLSNQAGLLGAGANTSESQTPPAAGTDSEGTAPVVKAPAGSEW